MTEEKKILTDSSLSDEVLTRMLDLLEKQAPDLPAWRALQMAQHEDNIVYVDNWVAVCSVGVAAIESWDGTNGYFELTPEEYVLWRQGIEEGFEPDERTYVTKQGLVKRYRFMVILDTMSEAACADVKYTIVKSDGKKLTTKSTMMSDAQQAELLMRRGEV